jgi:hypothetical protein
MWVATPPFVIILFLIAFGQPPAKGRRIMLEPVTLLLLGLGVIGAFSIDRRCEKELTCSLCTNEDNHDCHGLPLKNTHLNDIPLDAATPTASVTPRR